MNHPNLDALSDVFSEMLVTWRLQSQDGPVPEPPFAAEFLASRGILVPAALTDEQAVELSAEAARTAPIGRSEIARCLRECLERIAKGQA